MTQVRQWDAEKDMPSQQSDGTGFEFSTWLALVAEHNDLCAAYRHNAERLKLVEKGRDEWRAVAEARRG